MSRPRGNAKPSYYEAIRYIIDTPLTKDQTDAAARMTAALWMKEPAEVTADVVRQIMADRDEESLT